VYLHELEGAATKEREASMYDQSSFEYNACKKSASDHLKKSREDNSDIAIFVRGVVGDCRRSGTQVPF